MAALIPSLDASPLWWAKIIHENNCEAGWWDEFRGYPTLTMLICSELAEAMEGLRKGLKDDHLPEYPMYEVELADAAIRTLDIVGYLLKEGWLGERIFSYLSCKDWPECITMERITRANLKRPDISHLALMGRLGGMDNWTPPTSYLNELTAAASAVGIALDNEKGFAAAYQVVQLFLSITHVAYVTCDNNLAEIMQKKIEYNANRADHKRENRAKEGGKVF